MTEARDIRFAGTHPALLQVAAALGVAVAGLNTATLPDAVAAAVDAQGLPTQGLPAGFGDLFADLLRHFADTQSRPAPLTVAEARRRLLRDALCAWASREGGRLKLRHPHGLHVRGLEGVFRSVAKSEGKQAPAVRRWCMSDAESLALIASLRPVKAPTSPHEPRRGLDRTRPSPKGLPDLRKLWR